MLIIAATEDDTELLIITIIIYIFHLMNAHNITNETESEAPAVTEH